MADCPGWTTDARVPAHNLETQGTIYRHIPDNDICMVLEGLLDHLFEKNPSR